MSIFPALLRCHLPKIKIQKFPIINRQSDPFTPTALTKAFTGPDRDAAKRAFDAMMTMKKIDVAAIEAAVRG